MSSGTSSEVKLEIGHVLFIDIVGYSQLLITQQSEHLETLRRIVRGTSEFRAAETEGKLLRLPTGDGGALVFRTTPEAPVLCALEVAKELKQHPELRVRMGIHSGPVNAITDLNEQANIAGAGINIAQRVMDCGDAGHILLSKHVAEDLEHYPRWQPYLHDLGDCEVKHGDPTFHVVRGYLGFALQFKGQLADALPEYRAAAAATNEPFSRGLLGQACARASLRDEAQQILGRLESESCSRFVTGWSIAVIRLALGDKDGALAAVETGLEQHASEVLPLKYDPLFDELHGNPRFEVLVQKIVGPKK
jgi:hypothetical protein